MTKLTRRAGVREFAGMFMGAAVLGVCVSDASAQVPEGLTFYGAINQAIMNYDDGVESINYGRVDNAVGDNVNRFGARFDRVLSSGWDMTGTFEFGLAPKRSNQVSQLDRDNSSWSFDETSLRKLDVAFAQDGVGTFYIGHGDMSGKGSAPDFSGTDVIASNNPAELAGGNFWRLDPGGGLKARQLNESFGNYSSGRRLRLRYDSPQFANFRLSTSVGREVLTSGDDSTYFDVVARYDKQWRTIDLAVELSLKGLGGGDYAGGSGLAIIHKPSGLNFAVSTAHPIIGHTEAHFGYAKIGLKRDFFSFGSTAISYDYYNGGSFGAAGSESLSDGISIVQRVDKYDLEVFLTVRNYDGYTNIGLPNEDFLKSTVQAFGFNWTF
ncbi:hypothetical protein BXY66_1207 [Shimia isoporae]|uniref:Porin n=1 Tax=Shimia isoporae TaxID=647720 RepID=A0A4R1NVP5_9RHOB|nr:hypothetical protein [Shimia isoporae]TCL09162.1 hypothetical protein BXY66_1207 [Shimia isoporae]